MPTIYISRKQFEAIMEVTDMASTACTHASEEFARSMDDAFVQIDKMRQRFLEQEGRDSVKKLIKKYTNGNKDR